MREYKVTVKGETFYLHAKANWKARNDGIRLYMLNHPKKYTFVYLIPFAEAHLTHPEVSGRKPIMDFRLL